MLLAVRSNEILHDAYGIGAKKLGPKEFKPKKKTEGWNEIPPPIIIIIIIIILASIWVGLGK